MKNNKCCVNLEGKIIDKYEDGDFDIYKVEIVGFESDITGKIMCRKKKQVNEKIIKSKTIKDYLLKILKIK